MTYNVGLNLVEGQGVSPVSGVATGISAIIGNFVKGPMNEAVLITSFSQFVKTFGDVPATGSTSWHSVKGFFAAVGNASLYVIRVASDTAAKATVTLQDRQGPPANTLKVEGASEGTWGNALAVKAEDYNILTTTVTESTGASAILAKLTSISGLEVGSDVHFSEGVNDEYVRITQIDAANKTIHWTGGLTNVYTVAAAITSMEFKISVYQSGLLVETWTGLSMNDSVSFFCEKVIVSDYIVVTDLKSTDTDYTDMPSVDTSAQALTSGADGLSDVEKDDYIGVEANKTGKYALDAVPNLFRFCCPNPLLTDADPATAFAELVQDLLGYAYIRRTVQFYADVPYNTSVTDAVTFAATYEGRHLALFYPWGKVTENGLPVFVPTSSLVIGRAVEKDTRRGVFKSIGNEKLPYLTDLEYKVSVAEGETLNDAGVNIIRILGSDGIRVYGARTRSNLTIWRFIHYSELWNYIGRSLATSLQDVSFEPNDEMLWNTIIRRVSAFLANEQRRGALFDRNNPQGEAYRVVMDASNNPAAQIALGEAFVEIEYVPVGTAEKFVVNLTSSPTGLSLNES